MLFYILPWYCCIITVDKYYNVSLRTNVHIKTDVIDLFTHFSSMTDVRVEKFMRFSPVFFFIIVFDTLACVVLNYEIKCKRRSADAGSEYTYMHITHSVL